LVGDGAYRGTYVAFARPGVDAGLGARQSPSGPAPARGVRPRHY
jgi:hypothetical protein